MVQSVFSSRAITSTLLNPRSPVFNVTDKGERLERDFVSPMVGPFYVIFLLLAASLVAGYFRFQLAPGQREVVYITAGWATLNLVIIMAGLGALFERRQLRKAPRVYLARPVEAILRIGGMRVSCRLLDVSMTGARVRISDPDAPQPPNEGDASLDVPMPGSDSNATLPVRVVRRHGSADISLAFDRRSTDLKRCVVALGYGNSENLAWGVERDRAAPGILGGIAIFIWLAVRQAAGHFVYLVRGAGRLVLAALDWLTMATGKQPAQLRREEDGLEIIEEIAPGGRDAAARRDHGESAGRASTA